MTDPTGKPTPVVRVLFSKLVEKADVVKINGISANVFTLTEHSTDTRVLRTPLGQGDIVFVFDNDLEVDFRFGQPLFITNHRNQQLKIEFFTLVPMENVE